ncbi:hypothetical protein ACSYGO_07090 [Streptomyces krungchingensis]
MEAVVPTSLSETAQLELLAFLLKTADHFGHRLQKDGTSVIWVEVEHRNEL